MARIRIVNHKTGTANPTDFPNKRRRQHARHRRRLLGEPDLLKLKHSGTYDLTVDRLR